MQSTRRAAAKVKFKAPPTSTHLSSEESATNYFAVRATYRHLLRATGIAFKGDMPTLTASRRYARNSFREHRSLEPGSMAAGQAVEHAQGVTKILREHVVQGKQKDVGGETYKLNIHEHTQRLDNDTAGQLRGTTKSFKEVNGAAF